MLCLPRECGDEINVATRGVFQSIAGCFYVTQSSPFFKGNQEVDVAFRSLLVARKRSAKRRSRYGKPSKHMSNRFDSLSTRKNSICLLHHPPPPRGILFSSFYLRASLRCALLQRNNHVVAVLLVDLNQGAALAVTNHLCKKAHVNRHVANHARSAQARDFGACAQRK